MEVSFDLVDDLYFSALSDSDDVLPISDETYADHLQFQEVLHSSILLLTSQPSVKTSISIPTPPVRGTYRGESSGTKPLPHVLCPICTDAKPDQDIFKNPNCSHLFCKACIGLHVAAKVNDNISNVTCPGESCPARLDPGQCSEVLPEKVLGRWESALLESMVLASAQKVYCPYNDCSILMVDDGVEEVTQSVCPGCQRMFCAKCKVAWHVGVECGEYMGLRKDENGMEDLMLMDLAKRRKWKRCPKCSFFVERNEGCLHMTCRCTFQFCYGCGNTWSGDEHYSCQT